MRSQYNRLCRSPTLEIVDWRCTGHAEPFAAEEWSDVHEVVVARRGVFVRRVAGDDVFVEPGTVAFCHPGEAYRVRHPLPGGDVCSAFRLPATVARELLQVTDIRAADRPAPRFPVASAPADGPTYLLHRLAVRAAADPTSPPIEVEELALRFLLAAVAAASARVPVRHCRSSSRRTRSHVEQVWRTREVLARRYRERLGLSELAREVGCSPFHLSRLFTAVVGLPIHRAMLRLRLRDALECLLATRDGIAAVAYAAGFASHSHLADAFRREYGCSPSAVRRLDSRDLSVVRSRAGLR
jgi:AraC family transcriptional regulator